MVEPGPLLADDAGGDLFTVSQSTGLRCTLQRSLAAALLASLTSGLPAGGTETAVATPTAGTPATSAAAASTHSMLTEPFSLDVSLSLLSALSQIVTKCIARQHSADSDN